MQLTTKTIRTVRFRRGNRYGTVTNNRQLYLPILLPMVYFIAFQHVPVLGVIVAFKDDNVFKGVWESHRIRWDAFRKIFRIFLMRFEIVVKIPKSKNWATVKRDFRGRLKKEQN